MIHELAKKVCEGDFSFLYAFDFQLTQYTLYQLLISITGISISQYILTVFLFELKFWISEICDS